MQYKKNIWPISIKHRIRDESIIQMSNINYALKTHGVLRGRGSYNDDKHLPSSFLDVFKPIFSNLNKNELLNRCLKGLTQYQNEAINGILGSKSSKTKFCDKAKVVLAVTDTISYFITGAAS